MIDTGSTHSLINPNIANTFFSDKIYDENFILKTISGEVLHNKCVNVDLFNTGQDLKFFIIPFHDQFDVLLGSDALRDLNAIINYNQGAIRLNNILYCLKEYDTTYNLKENYNVTTIPINIRKGTILVPKQKFSHGIIPDTLTTANNFQCEVPIFGKIDKSIYPNKARAQHIDLNTVDICNLHSEFYSHDSNIINKRPDPLPLELDHLPPEKRNKIRSLCQEYEDIFYKENDVLTFTNSTKHKIPLNSDIPVFSKPYRFPQIQREEIERQIAEMRRQNIIMESDSPYNAPIFLVPKKPDKTGKKSWRLVVDFRKLNEKTIEDKYPIPNIASILDLLGNSEWFSKLDLKNGYWQIEINPEDQHKTAFSTDQGHWHFLRMPFGLRNAPACFARVMNNVLKGLINKICLVYLDDVIILGKTFEEHLQNLKTVFERLHNHRFKVQLEKSDFCLKEIEYLGHIVTTDGIKPNPKLVEKIKNIRLPTTQKQIKSFLGLTGYYRKFIKNYATITKPLTLCLKKNNKVEHTPEFVKSFENIKRIITNPPILIYPDFAKPFNVTTDSSNVGIGAVLSQGPIGQDKPIMYVSRTLNKHEENYSTIEKECLAIVWACSKMFRPYIYGRNFNIITDHQPLKYLFNLKEPNSRLVRWRLKLEEFDYTVHYKKGKNNTNADFLSRLEAYPLEIQSTDDLLSLFNNPGDVAEREALDLNELDSYFPVDKTKEVPPEKNINILSDIKVPSPPIRQKSPIPPKIPEVSLEDVSQHSQEENISATLPITEKPLNFYKTQFVFSFFSRPSMKIVNYFGRQRYLITITENNYETEIINCLRDYSTPASVNGIHSKNPKLYETIARLINQTFDNSIKFVFTNTLLQDVPTEEAKNTLLKEFHYPNHRGAEELSAEILRKYYWPNVRKDCQTYVNSCSICQCAKYERHPIQYKLKLTPSPKEPFDIVHMDVFSLRNKKYLTAIDVFSKYLMYEPLNSCNAADIVVAYTNLFSRYKLPKLLITDNQFDLRLFRELLRMHKVEHHFSTAKHPNGNSPIERVHGTILEIIKTITASRNNILSLDLFENAVIIYNRSIHSQTKFKPVELLFGHLESNDMLDIFDSNYYHEFTSELYNRIKALYEMIRRRELTLKEQHLQYQNQRRQDFPGINPDTPVYLHDPQRDKTAPIYREVKVRRDLDDKVETTKSRTYHKQEIKPLRKTQLFVAGQHDAPDRNYHSTNLGIQQFTANRNKTPEPQSGCSTNEIRSGANPGNRTYVHP